MENPFKTERAVQQQRKICTSLVELMQTIPYEDITVNSLCICANIPRRTFYYYFDSKEEVLSLLIQWLIMESDLESMILPASSSTALQKGLTQFFLYWKNTRRRELQALVRNELEQKLTMYCVKWVTSQERWMHTLESYTQEEQAIRLFLGISSTLYTLFHWCRQDFQQDPDYMAACVARILTTPLYRGNGLISSGL